MATIRDVARRAGVSISTVSLTINQSGPVSAETHERVWNAAREVGYAPNALAQSLKNGRSRLIGMVVSDLANPFFAGILNVFERIALAQDHLVIVSDTCGDIDHERAILAQLYSQRVAGIVLNPIGRGPDYAAQLSAYKMPIVTIDQKVEGLGCDFVASDNALAAAMLTEHLLRLGHSRIAQIAGRPGLWTTEMRLKGFEDSMAGAGLTVDPNLVVIGDYEGKRAYQQTMRLLTRPDRPTAIIAANNVMALGALQAINELGFRCPEEISLTSIDDVPWGDVIKPRITMVVQPIDEIARIASEWLLERIGARAGSSSQSQAIPPRERILIPSLKIGQSCARPAT